MRIKNLLVGLSLATGLLAGLYFLHAQDAATFTQTGTASLTDTNVNWNSLSDLEVELKAIEATPTVSATDLSNQGLEGNFYSAQHIGDWPPLPGDVLGLPVWEVDSNLFLVNDLQFNYSALQTKSTAAMSGALAMNIAGDGFSPDFSFPTNGFWLQINSVSNGLAYLTLYGTTNGVEYEILSQAALSNAPMSSWNSEGLFWGSVTTNWTATTVTQSGRTNLFMAARSWADNTGTGIPDWWWLLYFGQTTNVNPYGNPAGDGWNNLEKFQFGMNPNQFYTPPTPQGLTVSYNSANSAVIVNWLPSPGTITNYLVEKYDRQTGQTTYFNLAPPTDNFGDSVTDSAYQWPGFLPSLNVQYQIQGQYIGGNSAWSSPVMIEPNYQASDFSFNAILPVQLVAGPRGSAYLAATALPVGTVKLRLNRVDFYAENNYSDSSLNTNFDIAVSALTNGLYLLPTAWTTPGTDHYGGAEYTWSAQTVDANNDPSEAVSLTIGVGNYYNEQTVALNWIVPPYFDGRVQLKQNLIFLLRAATVGSPFYFTENSVKVNNPTAYAYSGFNSPYEHTYGLVGGDILSPFQNNYVYENFVFNSSRLSGGFLKTGVDGNYATTGGLTLTDPPTNNFQVPTANGAAITAVLATNQTQWLCSYPLSSPTNYLWEVGITPLSPGYQMANNARNFFGLPFLSANISGTTTLIAGGSTSTGGYVYPETAQPQFQTAEYDFWNLGSLPGSTNFLTTNTSDLLIASVGNIISVKSFAKLAVLNGYSGVYAYLGQYFDQAYQIATNGVVTTNNTGILSSYGQFFPTNPGPAALVTMPDPDTGQRGTCTVYAISLALDANHDGVMNTNFGGPDNTSASSPYVFWANNNYDRLTPDIDDNTNYEDDVASNDPAATCPYTPSVITPDCNYRDYFGHRIIPTQRDLEDFARLWVCGITSNLLAALPTNSTITLNWGDMSSPNPNNPTIDIFQAADSDGGIGYLTNETTAAKQIDPTQAAYVNRLAPGGSIQLNVSQLGQSGNWLGNHYIWCGVSNGSGQLNLTIADGNGNVLAQASQWIQIKDIKDVYERWTVGDSSSKVPTIMAQIAATDLPDPMQLPFRYTTNSVANTPYILLVHGWNDATWEKDRFAECAYKRLYWQGYQGRFGEFRWPTTYGFTGSYWQALTDPRNYDNGEFNAWQSAAGLLNLLTNLDEEYPSHVYVLAHSMGNVVAGEALRLAAQQGLGQVANTYVASQAALSAHNYDATVTTPYLLPFTYQYPSGALSLLGTNNYGPYAPDIYGNRLTNNIAAVGRRISFYNENDFALAMPRWGFDQILRPDHPLGGYYYYNGSISDPAPWNKFEFVFTGGSPPPPPTVFDIVNNLNNRYEVMAYAAPSYSTALGATPNVLNISENVDLTTVWPADTSGHNYGDHFWHSAEFRGDCWQEWNYWNTLLRSATLGFNISN